MNMEKLWEVRCKREILRVMESMLVGMRILRSVCGEYVRGGSCCCIIHVREREGLAILL